MKHFQAILFVSFAVFSVSGAPNSPFLKRDVDPTLVPEFGVQAGVNPTGTGDCDGLMATIKIPCFCPPPRSDFIEALNANVAAGRAVNNTAVPVTFPTGNDKASKLARMTTAIVTLQNLRGPGIGCPAASTTFSAQLNDIQAGRDIPLPAVSHQASPPGASVPALAPTPSTSSDSVDPALVPEFGVRTGVNPTGSGDCDGITNSAGKVIRIPCFCPPPRSDFIKALSANVALGHAVNNTGVQVSFPTGSDKSSEIARMNAVIVTLQNLRGAGVGCPAASTTFSAQLKAIHNGPNTPAPAPPSPTPSKSSSGVDRSLVGVRLI